MTELSSQSKFYKSNRDKILLYKKQFYKEKNKDLIFLKNFQINGLSRRDSNNLIRNAYDNNNLFLKCENIVHSITGKVMDYKDTCTLGSFMSRYKIEKKIICEGSIEKENNLIDIYHNKDINAYLDVLEFNKYPLYLTIYSPVIFKE